MIFSSSAEGNFVVFKLSKLPNSNPVELLSSSMLTPGCMDFTFIHPFVLLNPKI